MIEPEMTCDQARDLAAGYVLGALERTEEAAVHDHLASCDQPHPEFETLGSVVPALLELDETELVEPPAALRDRIMAAASADLAGRGASAAARPAPSAPVEPPIAFPAAAERDARQAARARTSRLDWALRIAAVIAIVAVGAWGLGLQRQLDASRSFDTAIAAVVKAAGEPGAKTVVLSAADGKQGAGIAAVAPDGSVILAMRDLSATTGSQVYTAWVIVGQNAPVSVGDFTVDSAGTVGFASRQASTPSGALIAVTLEPNAGNTAPKGPIVSKGIAIAPPGATS